jgi:hypothetical protein
MIAPDLAPHPEGGIMGETLPTQHPAVVLRSHFNALRALLAVALIAVVGLSVAVVILASDEQQVSDTGTAPAIGQLNYGGFNPATGRPEESAAAPDLQRQNAVGPDESRIATAIGGNEAARAAGGPDESKVADAIAGD